MKINREVNIAIELSVKMMTIKSLTNNAFAALQKLVSLRSELFTEEEYKQIESVQLLFIRKDFDIKKAFLALEDPRDKA